MNLKFDFLKFNETIFSGEVDFDAVPLKEKLEENQRQAKESEKDSGGGWLFLLKLGIAQREKAIKEAEGKYYFETANSKEEFVKLLQQVPREKFEGSTCLVFVHLPWKDTPKFLGTLKWRCGEDLAYPDSILNSRKAKLLGSIN